MTISHEEFKDIYARHLAGSLPRGKAAVTMKRAEFPALSVKTEGDQGEVEALVSIFGNIDSVGDRVLPGAFAKTILEHAMSDDPVPVVFSHDWGDPWSHIGLAVELRETAKGLYARYKLDIDDNPTAKHVFNLLKTRRVREHSFAYEVVEERTAKDGANELVELRLIEIGPTLKGANRETELLSLKAVDSGLAETNRLARQIDELRGETKSVRKPERRAPQTDAELRAQLKKMFVEAGLEWKEPAPPKPRSVPQPPVAGGFARLPVMGNIWTCSSADCGVIVDAGVEYCAAHHAAPKRSYVEAKTMGFVDLDAMLERSEKRVADLSVEFDEATAELARVRARVASFDAAAGG
jgi:HK97 family phage prohead protease